MKKVILLIAIISLNIFSQRLVSNNVYVVDKLQITGSLLYANKYESPITKSMVYLLSENKAIDSCITDDQGKYSFWVNDKGIYKLSPKITKPWGPLSPACSLAIVRGSTGVLVIKDPLALKAVALTNGKVISAYDALILIKRIMGVDNKPFPGGDWVSDEPEVIVDGDNVSKNTRVLCKGDILQSFVPDGVLISGKLIYDNQVNTPICSTTIQLQYNKKIIDSIQTDNNGVFSFLVQKNSQYIIIPQIQLPWVPVDPANIEAFLRYLTGTLNLTGLRLAAADINSSGKIESIDLSILERRIRLNEKTPFPGGDWVTETPTLSVAEADTKLDIKVLLKGDILGLYKIDFEKEMDIKSVKKGSVAQRYIEVINNFDLTQNYPNPFNPETTIKYSVPKASNVQISVYNMLGQKVYNLFGGVKEKGNYEIRFSAGGLATGTYIYTIKAAPIDGSEGFTSSRKMLYLK